MSRFELAFTGHAVDTKCVKLSHPATSHTIPLPCAVLALSVAVCMGAAGHADASSLRGAGSVQAEQRETLEHLLEALQRAAKDLTDRLDGQAALIAQPIALDAPPRDLLSPSACAEHLVTVSPLREALLNLPPPVC